MSKTEFIIACILIVIFGGLLLTVISRWQPTFCAEKRWVNDYTEKYYIVECPDENPNH